MTDVAERIRTIVVEHLLVEPEKVTMTASFFDDLGADSLDLPELQISVEDCFGIELDDEDIGEVKTFGDLVKAAETKVNNR